MSSGRVVETIKGVEYEIDVQRLLMSEVEIARNNALKHGLTAKLEPQSVLEWYRVIVNNPTAELPLLQGLNQAEGFALNLAQAEVRLKCVLIKISEFDQERDPLFEKRANLDEELFRLQYRIRNTDLPKNTRDATKILLQIITKEIRRNQRQIERRTRLLQRYKQEAMSKQRKSQKAWCDQFKMD